MKTNIYRANLLKGIKVASRAVTTKAAMPILASLKIESDAGKLKLTGNNLELGIETSVDAVVLESGGFCVDARLFAEVIAKLPESEVNLSTAKNQLHIKCEKSEFKLPIKEDTSEFSSLPKVEETGNVEISELTMKDMIRQTIFCTSDNEAQKMMAGIHMEVKSNALTFCALDGHRIAQRKVDLAGSNSDCEMTIPGKSLAEVSKIMAGEADKKVRIAFNEKLACFFMEETKIITRLIEGKYFDVKRMMTLSGDIRITANRNDLISVIDRASLLIQETDKKPMIFKAKDRLYVELKSGLGSMKEELEIEKEGEDITIGLNHRFMMEALRAIDDENVTMCMINSKNPCVIKGENYIYIVLPITIKSNEAAA